MVNDGMSEESCWSPVFDAVTYVALRSTDIGEYSLAAKSIGHQVGMAPLLFHDIIELH